MNRRWIAFLALVLVASSATVGLFALRTPSHVAVESKYSPSYHSPIAIAAESDFTKPGSGSGCECVRSGSGTETDPYVISDWIVNSTNGDGIDIWGTEAHFVITRVGLRSNSSGSGVYISDAKNGIVENSQIRGWWFGLYVFRSGSMEFINNTIAGNEYGIQLEASSNNQVLDNRIEDNREVGLFLRGSNSILRNNSVIRNGFGGINVDGTSGFANGNVVESNVVSDNAVYGIGLWRGANNVFRSNTVTQNHIVGIMLTDHSTKNLIETNTVLKNGGSGIIIIGNSSQNTIRQNTARGNGDGVKDFDLYDMASGNVWQDNTYDSKSPANLS
jgi:parallel beta-helix repeat protein